VRGPDVPLYLAGARLVNYTPVSIVIDGVGLNVTGFTYAGTMEICAISCREMLPDPAFFAACLRESFGDLKEAAERRASAAAAEASRLKVPARPRREVSAKPPVRKTARRRRSAEQAVSAD